MPVYQMKEDESRGGRALPVTVEYALTEKGEDFQDALKEMEKWAVNWGDGTNNDPRAQVE